MEAFSKIKFLGEDLNSLIIFLSLFFSILYFLLIIWFSDTLNKSSDIDSDSDKIEQKLPFISVIIAAHNEEKTIPTLLKNLKIQTYNKKLYEIIIIDDRSNDKTSEVIKDKLNQNIK